MEQKVLKIEGDSDKYCEDSSYKIKQGFTVINVILVIWEKRRNKAKKAENHPRDALCINLIWKYKKRINLRLRKDVLLNYKMLLQYPGLGHTK